MSTVVSNELQKFVQFIQAKLTAGETKLSPEEVLDQWRDAHPSEEERDAHPSEEEFEENVQAIQESLAEMDAGALGKSVEQLREEFAEFRRNRDNQP
jgi:Skp family chaperone for outer membrane proteins